MEWTEPKIAINLPAYLQPDCIVDGEACERVMTIKDSNDTLVLVDSNEDSEED